MKKVPTATRAEFRIHGMDCAEEVSLLRRELSKVPGILDLAFDVLQAKMTVEFHAARVDVERIAKAVAATGLRCEPWSETGKPQSFALRHAHLLLTVASGTALVAGALIQAIRSHDFLISLLAHGHHQHEAVAPASLVLFCLAIAAGMYYSIPKAWKAMLARRPEMNVLMVISITGAGFLGEWSEGATVAFLFSLANLIESYSLAKVRNAVAGLMQVAPTEAALVDEHGERRVPVESLRVGDLVRIRPGEKLPCDGEVLSGGSSVNQAIITGESVPVWKEAGSRVFAGTMNVEGVLEVRTSTPPSDTTLARIVRMVEDSQQRRSPSEQFVESFARYYTPTMILVAILVCVLPPLWFGGEWSYWFYQGMVILLISCPCALVISTPVTVVAALASAARHGVLIKGGVFLEGAARLRAFAFDKTGVLTQGEPEVQAFLPVNGKVPEEVLPLLRGLENQSEHPLAKAIVRYAASQGAGAAAVTSFESFLGRGAEAVAGGESFWAGNHRFLAEKGLAAPDVTARLDELEDAGHTAVVCGNEREVWALVGLADPVRPGAAAAIAELRAAGIEKVAMLTGDNATTARAAAAKLGIGDVRAELLPEDKVRAIEELQRGFQHVAMVGDGVNDAQAMAAATMGIALGRRSTGVALETADVVLMSDDLGKLNFLLRHARRAAAVIRQNVVIAIGLKVVFLCLAAMGMATLWMAIVADMGASLLVIFNGLRMLRARR